MGNRYVYVLAYPEGYLDGNATDLSDIVFYVRNQSFIENLLPTILRSSIAW
jgi:hypothetical protein